MIKDFKDLGVTMTTKSPKNNRQYAFNDFSDDIVIDNRKAIIRKQKKSIDKVAIKNHTIAPIKCNMTHVFREQFGWVDLHGVISLERIMKRFPSVREIFYSYDNEIYSEEYFIINNSN